MSAAGSHGQGSIITIVLVIIAVIKSIINKSKTPGLALHLVDDAEGLREDGVGARRPSDLFEIDK